jgi:signal transduction histidine kinase
VLFLKNDVVRPNFFTWMFPGPTTVAVSCTIALVFAILLSLPLRRLRQATTEMASGRLDVRVPNRHRLTVFGKRILDDDLDRLTTDFNRMAERIQGLVEAQNLLLRDVSHELRSPLARLNVTLALSRREADSQMQIHLDRIEREANKLGDLIGRLLSLSYMETTREIRDTTAVSLGDLVRNVLPNVQYEASLRRCSIKTRLDRDCAIRGDINLLESALENILRNALRYTPEDGIIEVVLSQLENGQRRLAELRVCDRGPGVPEDELEAILRPFYQVDRARKNKAGGYGLGLAIASRVVRLHGGNIVAANRNDGGLAVRMLFPVA